MPAFNSDSESKLERGSGVTLPSAGGTPSPIAVSPLLTALSSVSGVHGSGCAVYRLMSAPCAARTFTASACCAALSELTN